ncbi:tetratricopeptide repeat protein [Reichenbachiella sp. MALMAid0571]|uniref:tetratricopeptide repeat protein n=1 Tax=Reichenbachiella sp. MALMAid0571 TaxID=3143939 RepID=UPI0032DF747E
MRKYLILILLFSCCQAFSQKLALFDYPERMSVVEKAGYFIYNNEYEKADSAILIVERILPGHPIVYMMRALNIAWQEMPIRTTSEVFPAHYEALQKVIEAAEKLQEEADDHQEGVFFEMSARGLLTEYYAREGNYLKALGEARRMYGLARTGFDFVDENSEFLFSTGLYNYFREKYPERHPIYKPFMWIFKSGDIEKGLVQLDRATKIGKLIKIEAHLYLAYIYLRYENKSYKARHYLENLVSEYPNNCYFKSKLIECMVSQNDYEQAMPLIMELRTKQDRYYVLCSEVYFGVYQEKYKKNNILAEQHYKRALEMSNQYENKGLYYKSLCMLGMGKITEERGNKSEAEDYYKEAVAIDDNDQVTKEAKQRLKEL